MEVSNTKKCHLTIKAANHSKKELTLNLCETAFKIYVYMTFKENNGNF